MKNVNYIVVMWICVMLYCTNIFADDIRIKCGLWDLRVNPTNGAWASLKYKSEELLKNTDCMPTIQFYAGDYVQQNDPKFIDQSFGEAAGTAIAEMKNLNGSKPLELKLIEFDFQEDKKLLNLKYSSGKWLVKETVEFSANNRNNRLKRSVSFSSNAPIDLKFQSFHFLLYLPLKGKYLFPATFFYDNTWRQDNRPEYPSFDPKNRSGNVSEINTSGNNRVKFSFIEPRSNLSMMFFVDSRMDNAVIRYQRLRDRLRVDSKFNAKGWALPGIEHQLLGAYLEVEEKKPEEALKNNCPRILKDLGFVPPDDRPEWVEQAVIYGVETEPFCGEKLNDLATSITPIMKYLNANTAWYRPVEASTGRYSTINYKICEPKIGDWVDYRMANNAMHKNNLRVLQDIVPHGGGQVGVLMRGQSAKVMTFTEQGYILNGWGCDFNQPDWRKYMESVAKFYTGEQLADGFRVDAIYGSKSLNWRKKGFPDKAPYIASYSNISKKSNRKMLPMLWEQTMKIEHGQMPALEYPRASLASSRGGLNMVKSLRKGSREGNSQSALLLESAELPFTAVGDMHYDRDIQSCLFKLRALSSEDFVKGLSLWLEEQKYVDAPGTLRMRYMETGLTESWPYRLWYGLEGDKAIRAMCYYVHGIPMVYEWFTLGEGTHLARLGLLRKNIEALRKGEAFYQSVKSTDPRVFTVLRNTKRQSVLGVINFSPNSVETKLSINRNQLVLPNMEKIAVYDAFAGKKLFEGNSQQVESFNVKLKPFQNMLLIWQDAASKMPVWMKIKTPANNLPQDAIENELKLIKHNTEWIINNKYYTCFINSKTGLLRSFKPSGDADVDAVMDILKNANTLEEMNITCNLKELSNGGVLTVQAEISANDKMTASIIYTCYEDRLDVSVNAKESLLTVLSFNNSGRWQLDCFEGMLDDKIPETETIRKSFPSYQGHRNNRLRDRTMIWNSLENPLDWNRPELRIINNNGKGITLTITTPENKSHLYSQYNGKAGVHFFSETDNRCSEFKFSLSPQVAIKDSIQGKPVKISDKLILTNESYGWKVENDYYIAHILRHNGVISTLYAKTQHGLKKVLEKQDIIANRSMAKGSPYASALMDPNADIILSKDSTSLTMKFSGELRSAYKFGTNLNICNELKFNNSPEILSTIKFMTLKGIPVKPDISYSATIEPFSNNLKYKFISPINSIKPKDLSRGKIFKISLFDGFNETIVPYTDYTFNISIRVDGNECCENIKQDGSSTKYLIKDPGFEVRSSRYSIKNSRNISYIPYKNSDNMYWHTKYSTRVHTGIGKNNTSGLYMSWPNPEYFQKLALVEISKGKYQLKFWLKGNILNVENIHSWSDKLITIHPFLKEYTPFNVTLGYYLKDGHRKVITNKIRLPKQYDWKEYVLDINIDEDGYAPFIRVDAMPEYAGEIIMDDINFEEKK